MLLDGQDKDPFFSALCRASRHSVFYLNEIETDEIIEFTLWVDKLPLGVLFIWDVQYE